MVTIPRTAVRAFRNVLRSCVPPRNRAPAPPVLLQSDGEAVSLTAATEEVTLRWTSPSQCERYTLPLPPGLIDEVEGGSGEITFDKPAEGPAIARWSDRGGPRERPFEPLPETSTPVAPPLPKRWSAAPAELLAGLNEAARLAARADASGRYALYRVQVRGAQGEVVGTDARRALIRGGWTFPFAEAVLVPALPVFASREFDGLPAKVGRTATHFVIVFGPWTLWLRIDKEAKYPDVRSAVPDPRDATVVTLGGEDASRLGEVLPGRDPAHLTMVVECLSVTIQLPEEGNEATRVALTASTASGPPLRLALDCRDLLRAVAAGCRTLHLFAAGRPWVALGDATLYLATSFDPPEVSLSETGPTTALVPVTRTAAPSLREQSDECVLDDAEALWRSLQVTGRRAGRLFGRIATRLREERVLERLWTAVKSLPPAGGPRR
jgi:hypothetical protein